MSLFWDKRVRLTIGSNKKTEGKTFGTDPSCNHFISFRCAKTRDSSKNKGIITISNLSADERGLVDADYDRITLQLGYQGDTPFDNQSGFWSDVVDGWIDKVSHERRGSDINTIMEYVEAQPEMNRSKVNVVFTEGTSHRFMVESIINRSLGFLTIGDISGIKDDYNVPNGRSRVVVGHAVEELRKIAKTHDARLSIDNNTINIISNDGGFQERNVPVFNQNTGLIGTATKTEKGVDFKCLLHPKIRPNQFVIVQDEFLNAGRGSRKILTQKERQKIEDEKRKNPEKYAIENGGIFRVNKVVFSGDNKGGSFQCDVEGQKSDGYKVIRPLPDYSPVATVIPNVQSTG